MTSKTDLTIDDLKVIAESKYYSLCFAPEVDALAGIFEEIPNYYLMNKETAKVELTGNSLIMMQEFLKQADAAYERATSDEVDGNTPLPMMEMH